MVYAGAMALWAKRRGLALTVLACASACAQGVGLDGTDPVATTTPTTGTGTTGEPPPPTGSEPPTGAEEGTSGPADTTTTTTTTGDVPTSEGGETSSGDDTTVGPETPHPELYPYDRVHSPITAFVADNLRTIAAPAAVDTVFAKVGGTTTASASFFKCLATDAAIMDLPPELAATRTHFNVDLGNGVTPFSRDSAAAMPGWTSADLRAGTPTPVGAEIAALMPRYAHVLIGTHDLASDQPAAMFAYADNLMDTVDELIAAGAVPILSTLPQRSDMPGMLPYLPRYNAIVRAAAQGRQVPLLDLELALRNLPMTGLAADGVDLSVTMSAMIDRPCFFDEFSLQGGYNVRNLEGLRALDRAKQVVTDAAPELDAPLPGLQGSGTVDDPFEIPSLPFVDLRSTATSPSNALPSYGGACDAAKDESGPEIVYRLSVDADVDLRVLVFDRGAVDVDIHVLSNTDPESCLKRNDREITGPLPEGDYVIVVDSYAGEVMGGAAGEYILAVLAD